MKHSTTDQKPKLDIKTQKFNQKMGWFESAAATEVGVVRCKKHPKHKQSPGVCSSCLRERLSKLSSSSYSKKKNNKKNRVDDDDETSSVSSSSSCSYYSSASSSCSSSPPIMNIHRRNSISVTTSSRRDHHPLSFLINGKDGGLMRSRSVAFVAGRNWDDDLKSTSVDHQGMKKNSKKKKKKEGGFWSKLLGVGSSSTKTTSSKSIRSNKKDKQQQQQQPQFVLMHCKTVKETRTSIPFF